MSYLKNIANFDQVPFMNQASSKGVDTGMESFNSYYLNKVDITDLPSPLKYIDHPQVETYHNINGNMMYLISCNHCGVSFKAENIFSQTIIPYHNFPSRLKFELEAEVLEPLVNCLGSNLKLNEAVTKCASCNRRVIGIVSTEKPVIVIDQRHFLENNLCDARQPEKYFKRFEMPKVV